MDQKLAANLLDKESYYKDTAFISFSGLKVFSKCETLYRDMFVLKTYEEPEQDYFVYGKLVDAMVTEKPEFIVENFILVDRRVNPEDALKIENKIKTLNEEIESKREKAEAGNKTAIKGIESRMKQIDECKAQLSAIKNLADKQQVTRSVWENAEQTALALKTHPYFSNMEFNEVTSQQIFASVIDGIPRKGKLDHLKLSPALTKLYAIYAANQMSLDDLRSRIREMNPNDLWAIITDIKTCYDVAKLEPYNTHYRGQLGFYQDLVSDVLLIPKERIVCQILVADKVTNEFKKAELFRYEQAALDELKPDVLAWMKLWMTAIGQNKWTSAKEKHGYDQKCFTCSECRFCPFSLKPGDAVVVSGPRFKLNGESAPVASPLNGELSTVDALLDY